MKIIDMLNKIANGEEVRFKILDNDEIRDDIFEVENGHLRNSTCGKWLETKVSHDTWESISSYFLNEEVEIIEEEKIPKRIQSNGENLYSEYIGQWLVNKENYTEYDELLMNKINEIIDYLKSKEE